MEPEETASAAKTTAPVAIAPALETCRQEFLAHIGHELRAPISIMLAQVEALRMGVFGPISSPQRDSLQAVEENVGLLAELVSDIVELNRLSAEDITLNPHECRLGDICDRSFALVREFAAHRSVDITVDAPEETLLTADATRFRQMLAELLLDGIAAAPTGGRLHIHMQCHDASRGLLLHLLQNREQNRTNLVLAEKIVQLQGGELTRATLPAGGFEIAIHLPRCLKSTPTGPVAVASSLSPAFSGKPTPLRTDPALILVADGHKDMRNVICHFLESQNYRVCTAAHGDEAVEQANALLPHLVILDMQMPVMEGTQVIQRLRASFQPEVARLPIISLFSIADPWGGDMCLALGASAYLSKPFGIAELGATIARLLHQT